MIVSFDTEELHDCCHSAEVAEKELGNVNAQALSSLIADAEAFDTADQFIEFFKPEEVQDGDSLLTPFGASYCARFIATGEAFKRDGEGATDWSTVRRLKLVALGSAQ